MFNAILNPNEVEPRREDVTMSGAWVTNDSEQKILDKWNSFDADRQSQSKLNAPSAESTPCDRHPNSARFHEILQELGALHDKKQADYGRGDDPFANVRNSIHWGVSGWVGAMIRANDKIVRLQSLIANGKLANESAEDSLRDLAVYSIIALVLFEQEKK